MLINETFSTTFLDRESVPQRDLDIANRVRTNLLPWVGQFSPQLVEELLVAYGRQTHVVMDPFVGSGTLLVEAARLGKGAWGNDINPAAAILSRVYCLVNVPAEERETALASLESRLTGTVEQPDGPLFSGLGAVGSGQASRETALVRNYLKRVVGADDGTRAGRTPTG